MMYISRVFSLYCVELRRLLKSKIMWGISVLFLCAPLTGYSLFCPTISSVMTGRYIANPVLAGTTIGAVLYGLITIFESDKTHRKGTDVLTDSIVSQETVSLARTIAIMTISTLMTIMCAFVYLPYTATKLDYLFDAKFYFANFLVFMLPTCWISILLAEGLFQISRRIEISLFLYFAFCYFSFSKFASTNYFMRWLNPLVITYSDGFPSMWPLRVGIYTRIIWLSIAIALWVFSLICVRKYKKGLVASFIIGAKKIYLLVVVITFAISGILLWKNQPFIDHGPNEWVMQNRSTKSAKSVKAVKSIYYTMSTDPTYGTITVRAEYELYQPYEDEAVFKLNPGYKVKSIIYDGKAVSFRTVIDDTNGQRSTYFTLPDEYGKKLVIEYGGFPTQTKASYTVVDYTVDENYISLNGCAIFPIMENYECISDDITAEITIPDKLTPYLDFEQLKTYVDNNDGTRTYTTKCMEYVGEFTAGYYVTDTFTAAQTQIDFTYGDAYSYAVERYDVEQAVTDVFEYCTKQYGELGFVDDNSLLLIQKSSMFMGGYALPGMVQWFENTLSPDTLSDPAKGADATEVFIHEMIHQWWGSYGLICSEDDLWSSEGLTVYSTYRLVKEKYGEAYAKQYYVDRWQEAVDAQNRNFYNRHPEYLEMLPESYQAEIRISNWDTNLYMRMPLMILKAEQLVGGEQKMDEILKNIYDNRRKYSYDNPFTYQDFLDYCGLTKEELELE
ncbi:MAG: M1 family aminopeptidase [Coprococcus sp.]